MKGNICRVANTQRATSLWTKMRLLEAGILTCFLFLLQAKLENIKTELQEKVTNRRKQVDEINASLQSCKVSFKRDMTA